MHGRENELVIVHETPAHGGIRDVVILGSTGSIGTQALELVRANPDRFRVTGLAAGGADPTALAEQALAFEVDTVAVARADALEDVRLALSVRARDLGVTPPRLLAGPEAAVELVETTDADLVLNGITGSRGLKPTLAALDKGRVLALANKESLVAGGPLVLRAAGPGQLVPVDSEHSALAQCLRAGRADEVDRLILTASGGPFRGWSADRLAEVTVERALAHPTWSMGPVVTINSATLVNKGLELIETHLLFGVPYARIEVVVHPQSVIHSMVAFRDGSTIAQASPPDMRLPIGLALGWPDRLPDAASRCDFTTEATWTFEPVDHETFPALRLARAAGEAGGCLPAVYNAANEELVDAFVAGHTSFTSIVETVGQVLDQSASWSSDPTTVDEVLAAEQWARARARELACLSG